MLFNWLSRKRIYQFVRRDIFACLLYLQTFKAGLESNNREFEVYTYNDPLVALLEFKPNFYDLLLIDINLPYMNGFELSERILKLDVNVKVCFMSAEEVSKSWSNKKNTSIFKHRMFYTKASYKRLFDRE